MRRYFAKRQSGLNCRKSLRESWRLEMAQRIEISVENHIAVMTIRRPEKFNAFDIELLQELSAACDRVEADSSVRVAILTGEGKAFSAGGDIKAWGGMEPQE